MGQTHSLVPVPLLPLPHPLVRRPSVVSRMGGVHLTQVNVSPPPGATLLPLTCPAFKCQGFQTECSPSLWVIEVCSSPPSLGGYVRVDQSQPKLGRQSEETFPWHSLSSCKVWGHLLTMCFTLFHLFIFYYYYGTYCAFCFWNPIGEGLRKHHEKRKSFSAPNILW